MASFTERLELLITGTSTSAVSALEKTAGKTEELTLAQKASKLATQGTTSALQALGVPAEATGAALKVAAGAAGAFAAVKLGEAAFDMARHFADATGNVRAFQRVTGESAEDASRMVALTEQLGVNTDAAGTAFFQLGKRIGQSKDTLDEHGAAVVRNADGTVNMTATIESAATAYQHMSDQGEKNAFVMENFGKGGAAIIPILTQSTEALKSFFDEAEAHHQIFTQEQLESGRQFSLAMRNLDETFAGLKNEIGAAVAPTLTEFVRGASTVVTGLDSAASSVGGFGNVVKAGVDTVNPFNNVLHGIATFSDLAHGHFMDAAGDFAKALPGIGNAITGISDLFGGGGDSVDKFTAATQKGQQAIATMTKLAADGKTGTKEYADAQRDAADAAGVVAKASQQVTTSMTDEATATFNAVQQHLALAQANTNVQGSMLNLKQALADQKKAQDDANAAAQFGVDQSADVEAADIKSQQAILGVIDAAQKRAVQALGPSASAEAQHKAAVDATTQALEVMAATVPGTIGELQKLGYQVLTLPDGEIVVTANTTQAEQQLAALHQQVASFLQFAQQPGAYGPFGIGTSARSTAAAAPAGVSAAAAPAALGVSAMAAPVAMAAAAPVINLAVNVSTTGLGADAPEIQRAVVEAVRGYVGRNGRLVGIA